jgi:hypothetical protein
MTSNLHDLLHEVMADIQPPRQLLDGARAGGRRRLRRRRATVAAAAAGVLALAGVSADGIRQWHPAPPAYAVAGPLGDGGVHGDLARDKNYAGAVRAQMRSWFQTAPPAYGRAAGSPTILWAGTTPSGPAAVVKQTVQLTKHQQTGLWFIGTSDQGPRVAADNLHHPRVNAWYVDKAHRVLAVVDNDTDRQVAFRWKYTADGQARHAFEPLPFQDGVAVVALPAGVSRDTVNVADLPLRSPKDMVGIGNVELTDSPVPSGLPWTDPRSKGETLIPFMPADRKLGVEAAPFPRTQDLFKRAMQALESHTDPGTYREQFPTWYVYGTTPQGRRVIVFQRQISSDPARLYALVDATLSDLGPVDRADPLPVRLHLAGHGGWVVAAYGTTLRYRTGTGQWTDAGPNAALVTDGTTSVAVISSDGRQQIVPLRND